MSGNTFYTHWGRHLRQLADVDCRNHGTYDAGRPAQGIEGNAARYDRRIPKFSIG
jgi:hypothetical protein